VTNWNALLKSAEIVEAPAHTALTVEAPSPLVAFMEKLRKPGPNQGRQKATLPVGDEGPRILRATLKAAAAKLDPPASVTIKSNYAADDEYPYWVRGEERQDNDEPEGEGWEGPFYAIRDGAVPITLTFSVGDKRGARAKKGESDAPASE
jgi:hypothetical protein